MRTAAEPRLSIEMLVLQSTPFCNLDCSYCYLPDRASKRQMSQATLERTFERVFTSTFLSGHLTVLWHAGEPLVPGVAYYKNAFGIIDRLKPPGLAISHSIQTNATLLNRQWIDFLRAHDVRVGTSIDGPPISTTAAARPAPAAVVSSRPCGASVCFRSTTTRFMSSLY